MKTKCLSLPTGFWHPAVDMFLWSIHRKNGKGRRYFSIVENHGSLLTRRWRKTACIAVWTGFIGAGKLTPGWSIPVAKLCRASRRRRCEPLFHPHLYTGLSQRTRDYLLACCGDIALDFRCEPGPPTDRESEHFYFAQTRHSHSGAICSEERLDNAMRVELRIEQIWSR